MTAVRKRNAALPYIFFLATCLQTVHAGPPYVTDDPEPTETHQFENYLYVQGTHAAGSFPYPGVGIEINYGAFANTQLSWSIPFNPNPGPGGMGQVWAPLGGGIKYRFIQEDTEGWRPQVAVFPQIFIPIGSASHSNPTYRALAHLGAKIPRAVDGFRRRRLCPSTWHEQQEFRRLWLGPAAPGQR